MQWIQPTGYAHNAMVFSCSDSPVCMRGITSAMQRPIIPFPAREHRYLQPAMLAPKVNQPTAVSSCRRS